MTHQWNLLETGAIRDTTSQGYRAVSAQISVPPTTRAFMSCGGTCVEVFLEEEDAGGEVAVVVLVRDAPAQGTELAALL